MSVLLYIIFPFSLICIWNAYFIKRARWRSRVIRNWNWEGDFSRDGIPFERLVGHRVGKYEWVCNKCAVRRRTLNELFTNVYTCRQRDKQYAHFTIELSGHERVAAAINGCVRIVHCNWIWNYYRHIIYFFFFVVVCARLSISAAIISLTLGLYLNHQSVGNLMK